MQYPFTDFLNRLQNNPIVINQPNRFINQTVMLNTVPTTVPFLSRLLSAPMKFVDI